MRWQALADVFFRHGDRICVNVFFRLHDVATAFLGEYLNKRNFSGVQVGVDSDFQE
ncbi:hypothetical protein WAE31_01765 (plasmid) [Xanthomonas axonopodis pv. vasculorum]